MKQIQEAFQDAAITFEIVTPKPRAPKAEGDTAG